MNIFETIGLAWVIFTSLLATVAVLYLAFIGLKVVLAKESEVVVKTLPVMWGKAEDQRLVNVRVGR